MRKNNQTNQLSFWRVFKTGDLPIKASYLIMGSTNFANKQKIKGLLFLLLQISFIAWFIFYGFQALKMLQTLGTKAQSWVMDDSLGIEVQEAGDNSMLLLLFGIVAIMICMAFVVLYIVNLRSTRKIFQLKKAGKKIPNLREDLSSLLNENFYITLISLPFLGVLLFTVLPLVYMTSIAFTSYDHNHLPSKNLFHCVGFSNFNEMIHGDIAGTFFPIFIWTIVWAILATITTFFFGILLALLINTKGIKGKKVWRTIFVITMAVPQFVSLLIMANLFNNSGPINTLLQKWQWITQPISFLTNGIMAKITIIIVNMWVGIPVTMLVTTSILTNLPKDQIEAAELDGATKVQIFKKITFPQILFVMFPSLIQQFIININNFNVIFLLTGGQPANSNYYSAGETDLLVTWLYKLTVTVADYNLASVIGIIIFILSATFSLLAYTRSNSFKTEGV